MATDIELALMAGRAYESTRGNENLFPTPQGWSLIDQDQKSSGFEVVTFQRGNEIVISFAGTYPGFDDFLADYQMGVGTTFSQQLQEAAEYYLQIKAQIKASNPDAKITLTGHSLGGGLASLIAVFFNEEATTFDQAPFRVAATNHSSVSPHLDTCAVLLDNLKSKGGIDPSSLQPLEEYIGVSDQGYIEILHEREKGVTNIRVDGEILTASLPFSIADGIGSTPTGNILTHGETDITSTQLHSMSLLTAFLQCPDFRKVTYKLTDLLGMIFDEKLYAYETGPGSTNTNFIEHLVRYEFGNAPGVTDTDILTRFTNDMVKLGEAGGIVASNNSLQKMLIAFAMQAYYTDGGLVESGELFDFEGGSGSIHFSIEKVAALFAETKSCQVFFSDFLDSVPSHQQMVIFEKIFNLKDWYLQCTDGSMTAAASANESFMLGGSFADTLTGSDKGDLLYGMGGDDTIRGHDGDDYIEGGLGQDTMYGGEGDDTFLIMGEDDDYDTVYGGEGDDDTIVGSDNSDLKDVFRLHNFDSTHSIEKIDGKAGENIIAGTDDGDIIDLSSVATVKNIDRIEGGGGGDELTGTDGSDVLYGGSKEVVEDNARDVLKGGSGADTYYVGNDDIIDDADKLGSIIFNNQHLSLVLKQIAANNTTYRSDDGLYTGILDENSNTLRVRTSVAGQVKSFVIKNFTSASALGITLAEYEPPESDFDFEMTGSNHRNEMTIINLGPSPEYWDLCYVSFPSGDESSTLFRHRLTEGAPRLKVTGGDSGDFLFGFAAHDEISGGGGNDIIVGHMGWWEGTELYPSEHSSGDVLKGGGGKDWIQGSGGVDHIEGGDGNDFLQGYDGMGDTILGGEGDDVLAGGSHDAVLMGGEGDDLILGDGYFTGNGELDLDGLGQLSISYTYHDMGFPVICYTTGFTVNNDAPAPGNDTLYGGLGRDYMDGGAGSDTLFGGDDQDILIGGAHSDSLDGGSGNDRLIGDYGDLVETEYDDTDYLLGGAGDDHLSGLGGDDLLYGQGDNDTLWGGSGTGKTHMATALGLEACKNNYKTRFVTCYGLMNELIEAREERTLQRIIQRYRRYDLLILDELGYIPFSREGAELLFQVLAERYEKGSVMITTNLGFADWTQVFGDQRMTAALLDRLTHKARIINCDWDSYRLRQSLAQKGKERQVTE